MLEVKNVSKNFAAIEALKQVCFTLKKGDVTALLGENGAGKSTLLRIISGYIEASSGEVFVDKQEIRTSRLEALQKIGYVQEISSLYSDMSVYEFLKLEADLRKIPANDTDKSICESVKLLELDEVLTQSTDTLSKGYKKRVELAAVLLSKPQILLLDEPTEGLDPNQKVAVRNVIKKYAKNHAVIISTHTMEDVEAMATRVLLIHRGEIRADSSLTDFKKNARNDLLASFRKITQK